MQVEWVQDLCCRAFNCCRSDRLTESIMKKTALSGSDREGETDMTRKEIRKKGFTLMELLAVVAIIGILAALTAVGVIAYNRSLKVMELNNTAEEIYIAAQNHLTALRTNAAARDTLDSATGGGGYGTKALTVSSQAPADLKNKSQWDQIYVFDNSSSNTVAVAAYVLPAGAVDGTVAGEGNSYIIEYNPKAYTVYGVFYADGKSSVLGRDTGETISVTNDLANLNKEVKANEKTKITSYKPNNGSTGICVGYYGGSGAGSLNSVSLGGSISVKLVNAEKLYAEITTKGLAVSGASEADQTNNNIRLWITVTGKTSGAVKSYGCTVNASGSVDDNKKDDAWIRQGNIESSGTGTDRTVKQKVVLDDITTAGWHFAEIFGNGKSDNGVNFIPGEDIAVSAEAAVTDKLSNIVYSDSTQSTNSLFASLQKTSNGTNAASGASGSTSGGSSVGKITETVTIANFRHLENLSPRVSHIMRMTGATDADAAVSLTTNTNNRNSSSANLYNSGNFTFKALLTPSGESVSSSSDASKTTSTGSDVNSMSWSDFFKNTGHEEIDKAGNNDEDFITYVPNVSSTSDKSTSAVTDSTSNGSFSPIENPWLSEFDGNNVTIDGIYISSGDSHSEARGLFGTIDQQCDLTIKNLKLQNFDITSSKTAFSDAVPNTNNKTKPDLICAGTLAGRIVSRSHTVNIQNVISMENKDDYCGVWCFVNETNIVRNGGLIGELQTASDINAKITVEKCSASVYVQSSIAESPYRNKQPGLNEVDIAGGLIGHIEGISGKIYVENSYSGGHTENASNSPYYSSNDKQRGKKGSGRNVSSSGIAGGFVGAVYSNNAQIFLVNDYSTASVACASGDKVVKYSDAGGLIGYVSNNVSKIDANDCYSTGLVEGDNRGGVVGYVAKKQEDLEETVKDKVSNAFKSCCFLKGVNTDSNDKEIAAVNILTSHASQEEKINQEVTSYDQIQGSLYPSDVKTLLAEGSNTKAVPYDSLLQGKSYPFASSMSCHYGDWPNVQQNTAPKQNRLMLTYDTSSNIIAIRITGLQSGVHKYIVLNADTSKHPGPSVSVGDNLNDIWDFSSGSLNLNSDKNSNNKVKWGNDWKDIFTCEHDKETNTYHYELMLDNISTQFAGFASFSSCAAGGNNSSEFYYGEYIDVRITDVISSKTDLMDDTYVQKEYVTNTLFEDIFDPSVVKSEDLQNGNANLNSKEVQTSINTLKHNFSVDDQGRVHIENIDKPVTTKSGNYVAVIDNARHLENLRSSISKVNTQSGFSVTNAVQGCDIIWDGATAGDISHSNHEYDAYVDELSGLNKDHGGSDIYDAVGGKHMENGCFLPVTVDNGNAFTSYNGNSNSIYGLKLAASDMDSGQAGLFSVISGNDDFQISNLKLVNIKCDAKNGKATLSTFGTFVGESFRNLSLNNLSIEQTDEFRAEVQQCCGGLVGISNGKLQISGCKITTPSVIISAEYYVGGLVGQAGNNKSVTVDKCSITASKMLNMETTKQGSGGIGGIIGNAADSIVSITNSNLESPSVTISEADYSPCGGLLGSCSSGTISYCHISGVNNATENVTVKISSSASNNNQTGGLVGLVTDGSFAMTNSWLGADMATVSNLGSTAPAGGLIGEVSSSNFTLKNSYVSGAYARVMSGQGENQYGAVGGLIGEIKITENGACTISNNYFSGYVYGPKAQYVGGLIGRIEAGGTEQNYSTIENCYVSGRTYQGVFPQDSTDLNPGTDTNYSRFSMPDDQQKLQSKPIDSVIGYKIVGGLIGCHDNGYLRISSSFTSTSVAGVNNECYVGGLIGSTCGTLQLNNSYAVSTVEAQNQENSVLGSFIGYDKDAQKTTFQSACYIIKELNDDSVHSIGMTDNSGNAWSITELSVNNLGALMRKVKSPNDTDTVVRDDSLKPENNIYYANGYPYIISTQVNGKNHFDGCWVDLNSGEPTLQLSESDIKVAVNGTRELTANILPRWKNTKDIRWESSDITIATVGADGTVTGVTAGTATITAKLTDEIFASCNVTVMDNIACQITINNSPVEDSSTQYLPTGKVLLGFTGTPDVIVSWNVNNQDIGKGSITIDLAEGTTTVTATIEKDGVSVTKQIYLIGLNRAGDNSDFSAFNLYPNLETNGTQLPADDTRTVKGFVADNYNNLYLYISDSGTVPFGNIVDGSYYLYLKVCDTPVTIKVNDDNTAEVKYLTKNNNYNNADNIMVSVKAGNTQLKFKIYIPLTNITAPADIKLQTYGSTSENDTYPYTMTGLITF